MKISKQSKDRTSERGVTLIELVIVIVILGVVAGLASEMIFYQVDTYNILSSRKKGMQNSRTAVQMMARDIRQIKSPADILQASSDSIRFTRVDDVVKSYQFLSSQILLNGDLMLKPVSAFKLTYLNGSGDTLNTPITNPTQVRSVGIDFTTVVDGQSIGSKILVTPRNF